MATTSCTLVPHPTIADRRGRLPNGPYRIQARAFSTPVRRLGWTATTQYRYADRLNRGSSEIHFSFSQRAPCQFTASLELPFRPAECGRRKTNSPPINSCPNWDHPHRRCRTSQSRASPPRGPSRVAGAAVISEFFGPFGLPTFFFPGAAASGGRRSLKRYAPRSSSGHAVAVFPFSP